MGPLTLSSTILLPLRPPPLPFHGFTQQFVDPRLVTASLALQPRQHIGIHANRHRPLDGAVKLPHHGAPPFPYFRRIRQIDLVIRHPRQRRKLLCYSPGNLLPRFFLLRDSSASLPLCLIFFFDLCSPALLAAPHRLQVTLPDPCSIMPKDAFPALRPNQQP